jgi:NtrC-family two-component system response regulator AlgB
MAEQTSLPPPLRILVLDDEATIRTTLTLCLEAAGHQVAAFGTSKPTLEAAGTQVFDLLFLDLRLGIENGLDLIPHFLRQSPWLKIIVITAYASIDTAVDAMRRGAIDYLPKPFTPEHVEMLATRVAENRVVELRMRELLEVMDASVPPTTMSSDNHRTRAAIDLAKIFAQSKSAILIQGEDGTGKRSLARAIHEWSPRRNAPYMICTAHGRDEQTLGLELFGGGTEGRAQRSRMEQCTGGTLYIDDLCALPAKLQLEILEFIQSGIFEREENYEKVQADVRIIAGTSRPLGALTEAGLFRQDLYFAFSAKLIELPPLRERMEDFPKLLESYLAFYARQNGRQLTGISVPAAEYMCGYTWPGNLRELQNVVERAVLLARPEDKDGLISIEHLPSNLGKKDSVTRLGDLVSLERIEELHIRSVLETTHSLESAAKILGIDYATLWRRRKKYGL